MRHSLGAKAPRGYGWITNPKKAAYNRVYNRTTIGLGKGCLIPGLIFATLAIALIVGLVQAVT